MKLQPKGILPALVTPLTAEGCVNEQSLRKLINYVIDGGVHGVFVIGTTGEFYGLTPEEKREIIAVTVDETDGRVPVYAGTGAITTRDCIRLTNDAEEAGADAVSILTPMFISPSQAELVQHYETIADNTGLPIILYNNLPKTNVTISPAAVSELAQHPSIVGIKDSSGDFSLTGEYIRHTHQQEFAVLAGRDTLIHACLAYGGSGAIAACANVAPALCAAIYDRFVAGDLQGSLEAQRQLAPLRMAFGLGTFPAVIKEALQILGIDAGPCLSPIGPLSTDERQHLETLLRQVLD